MNEGTIKKLKLIQNNHALMFKFLVLLVLVVISACRAKEPVKWTVQDIPYGTDKRQTFNIILPKRNKDVYVITYLHGGAYYWEDVNKLQHPLFLAEFSKRNIFASIGYRLLCINGCNNTLNVSDILSDVHNALLKIREYANSKGYNVKGFILTGFSAGGGLVLQYSYIYLQENYPAGIEITAVVSMAAPVDYSDDLAWSELSGWGNDYSERLEIFSMLGTALTGYPIKLTQPNWTDQDNWNEYLPYLEKMSPIMYVSEKANIPPTLIIHARSDRTVPYSNALKLSAALENHFIPYKLISPVGPANNHWLGGMLLTGEMLGGRNSSVPILYDNILWVDEAREWINQFLK